jgi:hypothetical protein
MTIVMTLQPNDIDINQAIAVCERNGVHVSSEPIGRKFSIKVDDNGKVRNYEKTVYAHRINSAIKKTWRFHAAKILNQKKEADAQ